MTYRIGPAGVLQSYRTRSQQLLIAESDADVWVQEENELNNTMRTPTVCETWEPTVYVVDKFAHRDSTWRDIVPLGENAITAWWLDTDSSGTVNDSDAVCLIWTDGAEVWAMEVESGDTVRGSIRINGLGDTRLNVIDLDDDGLPELLCGSRVYDSEGVLLWDAESKVILRRTQRPSGAVLRPPSGRYSYS